MAAASPIHNLSLDLEDCLDSAETTFLRIFRHHQQAAAIGRPLLTESGAHYFQALLKKGHPALPFWDSEARQLWLGEVLVRSFRQPAPHQTRLLDVFQEQGWDKVRIDDPLSSLPGETEDDVRRRLHATLKNLNRRLPQGTMRFCGDGTGQGVIWKHDSRG